MRSQFVFSEIWIGLRRNLTMTVALIGVVAISLSLLGTGLLFVNQVDRTRSVWQAKVELSIFLCVPTSGNPVCQRDGAASPADES
jgi:cell division transport system permease protein